MDILADDHQGNDSVLPSVPLANAIVDLDHPQSLEDVTRAAATALAVDVNAAEASSGLYATMQPPSHSLPPPLPLHHNDPVSQYELPSMHHAFREIFGAQPSPVVTSTTATTAPPRARIRSNVSSVTQPSRMRFSWESGPGEVDALLDAGVPSAPRASNIILPSPNRHEVDLGAPHLAQVQAVNPLGSSPLVSQLALPTLAGPATVAAATTVIESRKRKRTARPEPVVIPAPAASSIPSPRTENECQICMEPWNLSGDHQLCCLECGHLYGKKCIKTWLMKKKVCPSCKQKAKPKDIRPIYGAPVNLTVVDEGEVSRLRTDLQKEEDEHTKTKRKLEESKKHANSLSRRLNALVQPSVHTFGHSTSRQRQPARSLSQLAQRTGHGIGVSLGATSGIQNGVGAFRPSIPHRRGSVQQLCELPTSGGSKALAFDDRGHVFFGEKRNPRQSDFAPQRIVRTPLVNTNVRLNSRAELLGRVADISVCCNLSSNCYSYVVAANQVRKLHILSRDLDEAMSYNTPGVPISCLWMTSQPNLVIAGLLNGIVCAYDTRMAGTDPLFSATIQGPGSRAVHSLAEIPLYNTNHTMLLAASPSHINAASFGSFNGNMTLEEVRRDGLSQNEQCCSLSVDGDQVLVTTRQANTQSGRHTIFPGLIPVTNFNDDISPGTPSQNRTLHFGRARASFEGYRQIAPFEPTAIIAGDGPGFDGMVVMAGDAVNSQRRTVAWEWTPSRGQFEQPWSSTVLSPVSTSSSSMVVRSRTLPPMQNVRHGAAPMRAIAGHLGDSFLQLFAVRRRL